MGRIEGKGGGEKDFCGVDASEIGSEVLVGGSVGEKPFACGEFDPSDSVLVVRVWRCDERGKVVCRLWGKEVCVQHGSWSDSLGDGAFDDG